MEQSDLHCPQLDESGRQLHIPVSFVKNSADKIHMNSMERHIVEGLKAQNSKIKRAPRECRICLDDDTEQDVVAPCKCTGSVQYVHVKCISQWIIKRLQGRLKERIRCEVCDAVFNYKTKNRRQFDCEQFSKNYQKQPKPIRCFLITYFTLIATLVGFIILLSISDGDQSLRSKVVPNGLVLLVYIGVIVIGFIVLLVVGILFISEHMVREEVVITDVYKYRGSEGLSGMVKNYRIYFKR